MSAQRTEKPERLVPIFIHCPKCGKEIQIRVITEPFKVQQLKSSGFDEGGVGMCACGVQVVIFHQPLPAHPSFYILVDVYETGSGGS